MTTIRTESKRGVGRDQLLLSVQRALLGAISNNVLGIYVDLDDGNVEMVAFIDGLPTDEEREDLDIATTEISADFTPPLSVSLRVVADALQPLCGSFTGVWVFLRSECAVS